MERQRQHPLSPQIEPEQLPGATKVIPTRALWLSLGALAVAIWGALTEPQFLQGYDALSWLLILVPAFLLAFYRGWRATLRVLAAGTLAILALELLAEYALGRSVAWSLLFWVTMSLLAIGVGLAVVTELLHRERRDALVLAYSDPLTGLPNRRLLEFMLEKEFAAAMRGRPLSVVLFDIDGFSSYNARYGRAVGDEAIRQVGAMFDRHMRLMNIGGRYESDAFLAILSGEKTDGAWVFAERTREAIAGITLPTGLKPRVSVGIAGCEPWMRTTAELMDLVAKAQRSARSAGGNRVTVETVDEGIGRLPRALAELPADMQAAFETAWRRQAMEDAEVRYRKLFDGVPVGLYRATLDGQILDANPALVRMFGYPDRQTLITLNARELYIDPADRARWQERLVAETTVRDFEVRLRRYDGSIFWGRNSARMVLGAEGQFRYYQGVLEDITTQKRAEEELLRANEKLRAVFDAAPIAVMALDPEGRVQSWNAAAERMLGWSEQEVVGKRLPTVSESQQDEFRRLRERVLKGELLIGVEVRRQKRDGSSIDLNVYAAPLFGSEGEAVGIMGVLVDVTERKELEARLAQSQKMESVGQLAGGIAHDFNNLLTVILGNCEIVLTGLPSDSPQRPDVEDIRNAADHAAALTRQLLAFSRRQILQPRVLSLNTVVSETLEMLGRLIGENIELITELEPALFTTRADPIELGQVLINLAVNARDAMPSGGRLTIKTENVALERRAPAHGEAIPPGRYVALTIQDSGVGMDDETLERIFEPFFTTKHKTKGTGLGLSTVYGIVKQSGGYIEVLSEPGQGTTFRIFFRQAQEAEEAESDAAPVELPVATRGSETVLLVEDEEALRGPMRRGLEREGYTVLEAGNAREAIAICETFDGLIHIMVTDLVMPGMDGVELARHVESMRPDMKVLFTSGYTDSEVTRHGLVEPGVAFLQKPYTPSELVRRIREILG